MFQVSSARRVGFAGLLCARTELVYEQFGYFAAHFNAASNKLLANNDDDDGQKLYFNLWFAFHHVNCEYLFSFSLCFEYATQQQHCGHSQKAAETANREKRRNPRRAQIA